FYTDKVNFSSLPLRDAVGILNALPEGVTVESIKAAAEAAAQSRAGKKAAAKTAARNAANAANAIAVDMAPKGPTMLDLDKIAASESTEVYRLSMRVWLAPFDMGVSQDVDILLMPSDEPGLYELQLRLLRQSGEISAWRRVNRQFMSDLRKQLLLWRTIKPEGQQEYILRGRAHVTGQAMPSEQPGAVVGSTA
ncbi:MAG TPA: hypothetical protein VF719_04880, partial [Abditibacteriaceae bacterium]